MKKITILLILIAFFMSGHAHAVTKETAAKQAYIVDAQSGQVLLNKNASQKMPTSSMSKVMTIYMVFEALKNGIISLDTEFEVSEKAWRKGGSKMFVEVGDSVTVEDLIRGVIVQSGNDATIVLAEGIAGDEKTFAAQLTAKAKRLGMNNSNFVNASGWPEDNHYSTAEDLSILARRIYQDFPEYAQYYREKEFTYNEITQPNRNPLLYQNIGADGLKTGHTDIAGFGLMGSAVQNDRRVFVVINGLDSIQARAKEAKSLTVWALNNFVNIQPYDADEVIEQVSLLYGKKEQVGIVLNAPLVLTVPIAEKDSWSIKIDYPDMIEAPIEKGQSLGEAVITLPDGQIIRRYVFAAHDVERKGAFGVLLDKMLTAIQSFFTNLLG